VAKPKPNRNISRIDRKVSETRTVSGGYSIRFSRQGQIHQAYCGDETHGGKRKALQAAREKRDEMEAALPSVSNNYGKFLNRSANNNSGTVGVRYHMRNMRSRNGKKTYHFEFVVASWFIAPGQRQSKAFSCDKHGRDEAWRLGVAARKKGIAAYRKTLRELSLV
jgi:hypothetical protein